MHVAHLSVSDFRSYASAELDLEPGVTALVGPNGQGKTNLVEAVGYVATLGSHRVATDAPLVRSGAERAVVRALVVRGGRETLVEIEIVPGSANRARLGRAPVPRARDVLGTLRTVLFAPEDLSLVKGDPDGRRRFLDDLLVARAPRFAGVRADYERVLRQRNALLKSAGVTIRAGRGDVRTLDVWDTHLATAGAELLAGRLRLVQLLAPEVAKAYAAVSDAQGEASVAYRTSLGDDVPVGDPPGRELLAARLGEALARARPNELERGVSLVGPHRDDLPDQPRAVPGEGFRLARGVVVAGARAAAGELRAAPRGRGSGRRRRARAHPRRRVRRARQRAPGPARGAGRERRAGAGHGGRAAGRARGAGGGARRRDGR